MPVYPANIDVSSLDGTTGFKFSPPSVLPFSGAPFTNSFVASAGDVNGDGFADIILGSPAAGFGGAAYVVFGTASGFGSTFDLATLNGNNGLRLSNGGTYTGFSVASAGDVNGDGFDDLILGSPFASGYGGPGASYVVFGKATGFAADLDLASLTASDGFRLNGVAAQDRTGFSVASAGDINRDGFDDLIVGARDTNESYVVFGKASGFGTSLDLSSLNGSNGFKLGNGGTYTGASVASAGDVNGDGFADLIVGAPHSDPFDHGESYVVFGSASGFAANINLSALDGSTGFRLRGSFVYNTTRYSGYSVAGAGDINGDGFDDVIIGAPGSAGAFVVFGKASGFGPDFDLDSLDGTNGFKLVSGRLGGGGLGKSVAAAGDVDGDGFDDLIVGAPGSLANQSYVVFGKASGFAAGINLSSLDGSDGFSLTGAAGDSLGFSVASTGDVNGDGGDDLIVAGLSGNSYVIYGTAPSDPTVTKIGTAGLDILKGGQTDDFLLGMGGNDRMYGYAGDDTLAGGNGNDVLAGGTGDDVLSGGSGTDTVYYAAELAGVNANLATGKASGASTGHDTLASIENLTGSSFNDVLTGDTGANVLIGGAGNDTLNGGLGADAMTGGAGNDIYYVDSGSDSVTEIAGGGIDTVRTTLASYTLGTEVENLAYTGTGSFAGTGNALANTLTGGAGNDTLDGGAGNDKLNGGLGADAMTGGADNDIYHVDNFGDTVTEAVGGGSDIVYATADWSMAAGQEIENLRVSGTQGLTLTGNELVNSLLGGIGGDTLNGGAGNDTLNGGDGDDALNGGADNDKLNGGTGADVMTGGSGNDIYYVDNFDDQVIEDALGGNDIVYATADWSMAAGQEIENLRVSGTQGLTLTGNELANSLLGGIGNDTLNGGAGGNDTLSGGDGNDKLNGGTGNDTLTGGNGNDVLTGGADNDRLNGGDGDDTLDGGLGTDTLTGGAGNDTFQFDTDLGPTNVDRITDFSTASDSFTLNQAIFSGLSAGPLSASAFSLDSATGSNAQIVYNHTTGALFYDTNGSAAGGSTQFATVTGAPTLDHTSFKVLGTGDGTGFL